MPCLASRWVAHALREVAAAHVVTVTAGSGALSDFSVKSMGVGGGVRPSDDRGCGLLFVSLNETTSSPTVSDQQRDSLWRPLPHATSTL
jgi:hypothetical protein